MGGPEVALIMSAVSTGLTVVGSIQQGKAEKQAAELERRQIEGRFLSVVREKS
jgi:hypothetical protein